MPARSGYTACAEVADRNCLQLNPTQAKALTMSSTQTEQTLGLVAMESPSSINVHKNDSVDASVEVDSSHLRDSRAIDCQTPIPEEDESNETASEPIEPDRKSVV